MSLQKFSLGQLNFVNSIRVSAWYALRRL